ncbi:hypothetical protein [Bartonella sp. TT119HLJHH]|uniref:hypothetical protein n=1 Tax=Bartonella sp. TT119HLJHH TaxID=3243579 RepID=UPI0035CFDACC
MPIPSQVTRAVAIVRLGKEKDRENLTERKEREKQGKREKQGEREAMGGGYSLGCVNFKSRSQSILEIKRVIEALDFESH